MKFLAIFLTVALVASASALPSANARKQLNKSILEDIIALQKCMDVVTSALQTVASDILTEIRALEALINQYSAKAEACYGDNVENPSVPELVEIATCLGHVYTDLAADLLEVVHRIQNEIHSLVQIPADIEKCMHPAY